MGAVYNGLVNPVAIDAIGWKYYLVFVVLNWVSVVVAWFLLVETKRLTLEDIAVLFDGEEAAVITSDSHKTEMDESKPNPDQHVEISKEAS
ncbi:hypothetical protein BCR39DRAFT_561544 [Naematelia encephala]|uniref:Major facilitator superfamily (MFS) profile domain-containing protein n=1 Tax=Naematelia encephala TaxID=71784 RepID=A0A1Y2APU0_9TREE|nr:hypothetical protein BCR39DRAFT_561544 [Naematelia encephala]